jgi:hypothetical protein
MFNPDPVWTVEFFASAILIYKSGVMSAKELELLSISCGASFSRMYVPAARRHIKAALKAGFDIGSRGG